MNQEPIKLGDVLYGAAGYIHSGSEIKPFTIETIGRKYFTVKEQKGKQYFISTLRECAGHNYLHQLYRTEQEIVDQRRHNKLSSDLSCLFAGYNFYRELSIDQLERINAIINEPKAE